MLPESLLGSISKYKADTDAVAAWLAATARVCGYKCNLEVLDDAKPPGVASGRLKGKARKEAKKREAELAK
jgi:hypothetical protein